MAATGRMNHELKRKAKEAEKNCSDPVELLRCKCLQRGANGIKGLARYVFTLIIFMLVPAIKDLFAIKTGMLMMKH